MNRTQIQQHESIATLNAGVNEKVAGYLPTLDGWRAFAILGVIFSHVVLVPSLSGRLPHWVFRAVNGSGTKGVQLFFAISGFLITSRLVEEWNRNRRISLKRFYVRRACRILPPAMGYLAVLAILALAGLVALQWKAWISATFFFRNYTTSLSSVFDEHFWTLSLEEQFYLIWPALLVLSGLKRARFTAGALIVGVVVWRSMAFHHVAGINFSPDAWAHAEICFDGLLWGCFFALALENPRLREWVGRHLSVTVVSVIVAAIAITGGSTFTPAGRTIQSALIPLLIVATVLNPHTWLGRLLEIRVIRRVGRLSYSLYIWQQLFTLKRFLPWYALQLAALFAVAALSFYLVERPMIRLGYRLAPASSLGHSDLGAKT